MDTDNKDFYPTPDEVICKMLENINISLYNSILEPSAGKGNIIKALIDKGYKGSIDFIEPVEEFCSIVKNIEIKEVKNIKYGEWQKITPRYAGNDFLSFQTFKKYDLIIMNPPFSNGDKHLLKAIELMQSGGRIICLLNSETLNNPYSNIRKDLLNQLQKYNADITDLGQAFLSADRKTNVNISMINISIPVKEEKTYIFEGIEEEIEKEKEEFNNSKNNEIVISEPIQNLVEHYKMEIIAGKRLYEEFYSIHNYLNTDIDEITDKRLCLSISFGEYVEITRYKYWKKLLNQSSFTENMTGSMLKDFQRNLNDARHIEFNYNNIYQVAINSIKNAEKTIKQELVELFDKITYQSAYNKEDNTKIHMYNGWKTNKSYKVDKKFILRVFYKSNYFMDNLEYKGNEISHLIYNIEKAFAWLDYNIKKGVSLHSLRGIIEENIKTGNLKNIETHYFYVTLYKKGTVHFTIKDEKILKRFNLLASQEKNWLPPSYAKKTYQNLSAEEKEVIDSYEGEKSYTEVVNNPKEYLFQPQLALT